MTAYVPAVDLTGDQWWLGPNGHVWSKATMPAFPVDPEAAGWRRLYVAAAPPPFEHSDMCEDRDYDRPHLASDGACGCLCDKCEDGDGYCICGACSRPTHHAHRPDRADELATVLNAETHDDLGGGAP